MTAPRHHQHADPPGPRHDRLEGRLGRGQHAEEALDQRQRSCPTGRGGRRLGHKVGSQERSEIDRLLYPRSLHTWPSRAMFRSGHTGHRSLRLRYSGAAGSGQAARCFRSGRASNECRSGCPAASQRAAVKDSATGNWKGSAVGIRERVRTVAIGATHAGGVRRRAPPRRRPAPAGSRCSASGPRAWPVPSWRSPTTPPRSTGIRPASAPATSSRWRSSGRTCRCRDRPVAQTRALRHRRHPDRHAAARGRLLPPRLDPRRPGDARPVDWRPPQRRWGSQGRVGRGYRRGDPRPARRRPRRDGPDRSLARRPRPAQPGGADLRPGGHRLRRQPLPARAPRPSGRRRSSPATG